MDCVNDFTDSESVVTVGATVVTGFEKVAMEEIAEKVDHLTMDFVQGKVFIQMLPRNIPKLHQLLSVDNLFLVIKYIDKFVYPPEKGDMFKQLSQFPVHLPWNEITKFWRFNLIHCKRPAAKDKDTRLPHRCDMQSDAEVRFRVSSNRVGKSQCVTSPDADFHFGSAVQDITNWKVDLTGYNLELLFSLGRDSIMIAMSLTFRSLHRRHISHYGKTTLKPTIAYNMLRMCKVKPGEVVVDPMCGTGVIPIEGTLEWSNAFYLAADNAHPAIVRVSSNIKHLNTECGRARLPVDVMQWDATVMPWRTGTIDVSISDLPFGKRLGSHTDNRKLYPQFLHELARVSQLKTGRACLLTHDKRSITNAIAKTSLLWKVKQIRFINIGGLRAGVYLLQRTLQHAKDIVL